MAIDNDLYNRVPDAWWSDDNCLTLLRTGLNHARFGYFREALLERLRLDPRDMRALDVGCGGGLLAEEFARIGCEVTGVDPSEASLETARAHAKAGRLLIDYRQGTGEQLPFDDRTFDIAYCCDVLEHVADVDRVIGEMARVLKPGGVFCYDTINRTWLSWLVEIKVLQDWPLTRIMYPNLHDWRMFIKPSELHAIMARHGLRIQDMVGLQPRAPKWKLAKAFVQLRRGLITYAEAGRRLEMGVTNDTRELYMGFALREGQPHREQADSLPS
jgi:2-polyprenyl-6-hydroxyphenyl methylase/3-demethylubiquinone-9 3-methyltransferase